MESATSLKFDTVRFVTKTKYLSNPNKYLFKHDIDIDTGELISIEYQSRNHAETSPSELYIRANYRSNRMIIGFSSKLLLNDYPSLISSQTFRQCLSNIGKLGICELDIDGIINDCYFNKLHITKDINLPLTSEILNRLMHRRLS